MWLNLLYLVLVLTLVIMYFCCLFIYNCLLISVGSKIIHDSEAKYSLSKNFHKLAISYIIKGVPVTGPRPFFVQIKFRDQDHYCGGAIVDPLWVVTAGHCVATKEREFYWHLIMYKRDPPIQKRWILRKRPYIWF